MTVCFLYMSTDYTQFAFDTNTLEANTIAAWNVVFNKGRNLRNFILSIRGW